MGAKTFNPTLALVNGFRVYGLGLDQNVVTCCRKDHGFKFDVVFTSDSWAGFRV